MKRVLFLMAISLMFQNCASFRGGNILKGKLSDIKPEAKKISLDYNVTVRTDTAVSSGLDGKYASELKNMFTKSNKFERILDGKGKENTHIDVLVDIKYLNMGAGMVSAVFCGLTLTAIPCYMGTASHNVSLDVFQNGKFIKSYKYSDMQISYWGGILIIPFAIFADSNKEIEKMLDQTYIQFIMDLDKDGFFEGRV